MGSDSGDDEKPTHEVAISTPFYMGIYEVTNAQWKQVMGAVPSNWKDDNRPVEQVSWHDATEFCRRLSELPQERAMGRVYRLPTEAEWEYACRAGTKKQYSFGDDESQLGDYGWFDGNAGGQTQPVGAKKPNPRGLYDMHGNVWEWCGDWHDPSYYDNGPTSDPAGPASGSLRILRGGSWYHVPDLLRSTKRIGDSPTVKRNDYGFRVACELK